MLGDRDLVVAISGLTNADPAGREVLFRMRQSGARGIPALPAGDFKPPAEPVTWPGTCSAGDVGGMVLGQQNPPGPLKGNMPKHIRTEDTRMWIVLIALIGFCLVLPKFENRPRRCGADRGGGPDVVRAAALLLAITWADVAGSLQTEGESLFKEREFKAAAHAFERALTNKPGTARLHFWLGKSYARMAEVLSLLSASRNARKARVHLEAAVQLDPDNRERNGEASNSARAHELPNIG